MSWNTIWNTLTAISTTISVLIISVTGYFIYRQLREMRMATIATAFSAIMTFLQDEKVRKARKILMNITKDDINNWTTYEKTNAEIACSTYDTVGIMLRKEVINPEMVTAEWRHSIIKCWEKAQPMIKSYRKERGEDFWNDFQWLYKDATILNS